MKKLFIVIVAVLALFLNAEAQVRTIVDTYFSTNNSDTLRAQVQFAGPFDISDCWTPIKSLVTPTLDSTWQIRFGSTIFNTADSGAVAADLAVSNEYCTPSKGLAGTTLDTLLVETDTCCTASGQSTERFVKWFLIAAAGPAVITANTDTVILHASNTDDRTAAATSTTVYSATPKKYAYIRYTAAATNSHYNKAHHVVTAVDKRTTTQTAPLRK